MQFEDFLKLSNWNLHHAVLLLSQQFKQHTLPDHKLIQIANSFCKIKLSPGLNHPDLLIIDRERPQLRLEDIQKIKEFCLFQPQVGTKRLILIENCERLNLSSANYLLKSLEEPNAKIFFVFTSSRKHLILQTILSRLQKIIINFNDLQTSSLLDQFDDDDVQFFKSEIFSFSSKSIFFGKSLTDKKSFHTDPKRLVRLMTRSEQIAKKYTHDQLQAMLLYWVSERLKKERAFVIIARFIVAHVRDWKQAEPLNPSSQFWLLRIFLGQQTYENS